MAAMHAERALALVGVQFRPQGRDANQGSTVSACAWQPIAYRAIWCAAIIGCAANMAERLERHCSGFRRIGTTGATRRFDAPGGGF